MKRPNRMKIGERIREVFMTLPKSCNVDWLAAQLNCERRNVYRIFRKDNIDIELLGKISVAFNHDFFKDLSDSLSSPENSSYESFNQTDPL